MDGCSKTEHTCIKTTMVSVGFVATALKNRIFRSELCLKMLDHKVTLVLTLSFLLYFMWMDVALFYHVHCRTLSPRGSTLEISTGAGMISPFTGLSVKMMMMDPVNNYVHTPTAHLFNEVTHFSKTFYFVTPNMLSVVGLVFALAAAKFVSLENRGFHYVAIVLFQVRTWFDALDGIVARSRLGLVQHVSLRNTSGYVVDGVADALGFAAFLVGCYQYLRKVVPKHKHGLPFHSDDVFNKDFFNNGNTRPTSPTQSTQVSPLQRRIFLVVLCFGCHLAISAYFWDYYIDAYHKLLESPTSSIAQTEAQNEVLRSAVTWILMWFWRISNAHNLIQLLLFAIYVDKMWEFLLNVQFVGFVQVFILAFFSELHLSSVRAFLLKVS